MTEEKRPSKEEVRARLKEFLQKGEFEDVASVLVHTLNHRADKMVENKPGKQPEKPQKK